MLFLDGNWNKKIYDGYWLKPTGAGMDIAFLSAIIIALLSEIKGYRITRQGLRVYRDRLDTRKDPRGKPYYWIGGDAPSGIPEDGTDIGALADEWVSVTPLQLDLTAYPALHLLKSWKLAKRNGVVSS